MSAKPGVQSRIVHLTWVLAKSSRSCTWCLDNGTRTAGLLALSPNSWSLFLTVCVEMNSPVSFLNSLFKRVQEPLTSRLNQQKPVLTLSSIPVSTPCHVCVKDFRGLDDDSTFGIPRSVTHLESQQHDVEGRMILTFQPHGSFLRNLGGLWIVPEAFKGFRNQMKTFSRLENEN